MRETRTKLFTDSFNMANTQSSIKSSSKWSFYTVQIGNFNRKSAWKSITDQTSFRSYRERLVVWLVAKVPVNGGSNMR